MFCRHSLSCRLMRPAAFALCLALFTLGKAVPTATAADAKDDAIQKLEEQLRRATDRIDELQKMQKQDKEENARLREESACCARMQPIELAALLEKAKTENAKVTLEALRQRQVADVEKKRAEELAAVLADTAKALEKERARAEATRQEAEVQRAVAEKSAPPRARPL